MGLSIDCSHGPKQDQMLVGVHVEDLWDKLKQGGHGTGKTGNLVLNFSRQGKHREFCFDTGKNFETQGKYFFVTQGKL